MFYKVLIIDDEPWIIDGMKKTVAWEQEGFTIVGDAVDAFEGIDKIHKLHPDVVFVDIRMPEMTGLEMIHKLAEYNYNIKFVVISGYSDFIYAKESITLGVFEYILKPIDKNELRKILNNLSVQLKVESKRKYFYNLELLEQLSQSNNDREQTKDLLCQLGINSTSDIKRTAVIRLPYEAFSAKAITLKGLTLKVIPISAGSCFAFTSYKEMCEQELQITLREITGDRGNIGVSSEICGLDFFFRSIREAELAECNKFISGEEKTYFYRKPDYSSVIHIVNKVIRGIDNMDFMSALKFIENLDSLLTGQQWGAEEAVLIYNLILQHAMYGSGKTCEDTADFLTADNMEREFKNFSDFKEFLRNVIINLQEEKMGNSSPKYSETIKNIIAYLNSNISEEVRLTDVSNRFFINPNYLSIIFRQSVGKTFTQYLTEIRMQKACSLLTETSMSIEEICCNVGYTDYYSFIKAFKKLYGITPGKFKQNTAKI